MSAVADIASFVTTMTTYWSGIGAYLQNPNTAYPVTNYSSVLSATTYGDLVTQIQQSYDSSTGASFGAMVERQESYSAQSRDIYLRTQAKAEYYSQAIVEFDSMSTIETAGGTLASSFLAGTTPYQSYNLT